jgi:hypothetical protein
MLRERERDLGVSKSRERREQIDFERRATLQCWELNFTLSTVQA